MKFAAGRDVTVACGAPFSARVAGMSVGGEGADFRPRPGPPRRDVGGIFNLWADLDSIAEVGGRRGMCVRVEGGVEEGRRWCLC